MSKKEDNSEVWSSGGDVFVFEDLDKYSIDLDTFYEILSEEPDPLQNQFQSSPEELPCKNFFQGEATPAEVNHGSSQLQNGTQKYEELELPGSSVWCPAEDLKRADSKAGMRTECMFELPGNSGMIFDHGNMDSLCHLDSPLRTCSVSLGDWSTSYMEHDTCSSMERDGGARNAHFYNSDSKAVSNQIPNCGTTFNFTSGDPNGASGCTDHANLVHLKNENGYEFGHAGGAYGSKCASLFATMDESGLAFGDGSGRIGSGPECVGASVGNLSSSNMDVTCVEAESLRNARPLEMNGTQCKVESFSGCVSVADSVSCADSSSRFLRQKFDLRKVESFSEPPHTFDLSYMDSMEENLSCTIGEMEDQLFPSQGACLQAEAVADLPVEGYHSAVTWSSACGPQCGPCLDHSSSHLACGIPSKQLKVMVKDEKKDNFILPGCIDSHTSKFIGQIFKNSAVCRSQVDDDPDICILEDISDPRHPLPAVGLVTSQRSASDPLYHTGTGGTRLKTNDERLTFRAALQDLSQPKSEATPPDGVMAVPLMRHQRIALSWMVQKETASFQCSGGILADDQGLGKTISTIALILKERPPSSKMSSEIVKQDGTKALNLDDDDDDDTGARQLGGVKQDGDFDDVGVDTIPTKSENAYILSQGRPAAGTLIVCPTSVLRQWAEELHNKVTREAKLSVLVYHGTNRTKDPSELTKYDVVVTTYSIVSMEVPKQPLVDKDDDEKVKAEGLSPMELSSCKKRKYPSSSDKKSRKEKKGLDGTSLDSARPLAKVGWFRVVLDEAQSIKNHRTQVARACWGLRAKRRWCLSGTPIQNAVDDLYSYFRFLRYDPYASYKLFCSMIKVPINRNPTTGYKKLQAVLKTVMLRRTKGTHIDGEPIINLPPKSVELKKVDFSMEERDFYSKLEADSRAQFKVYAAAGTVQQNYVNILLMLLRLRQACDHPLLVNKGYDSNSVWSSSLEMAKKLPREKQTVLLGCLEACMAICGICNDPPEEAVVTICGHVFCNQCISEHLTGDDNICPAAQCKVQLNATSVFTSSTLKSSLFDQPGHDVPASQPDEAIEPFSVGLSDSSKIKAALQVLESLSKPRVCISSSSSEELAKCPRNASDSHAPESFKDIPGKILVDAEMSEDNLDNSSTKVLEKAIVFSQWTRMLDLLEARLKTSSIQYRRLDGTMSVVSRDKAVKDFNTLPEVTVMIMSLKAASLGLNMVAACHVLLLDLWWNPTTEDQAIDRAHRIGQTRPVTVLRLTVKDTVEDRILALQQKKREMVASAFGEDETGSRQSRLTVDDLKYLFMA